MRLFLVLSCHNNDTKYKVLNYPYSSTKPLLFVNTASLRLVFLEGETPVVYSIHCASAFSFFFFCITIVYYDTTNHQPPSDHVAENHIVPTRRIIYISSIYIYIYVCTTSIYVDACIVSNQQVTSYNLDAGILSTPDVVEQHGVILRSSSREQSRRPDCAQGPARTIYIYIYIYRTHEYTHI